MQKLSIIVPAYNEIKTLQTLLNKLDDLVLPNNFQKEIIVVDDGSKDGTRELIASLPERFTKILKEKNEGKGATLRAGLKHATGEYVVVQDADLEYEPKDLAKMLQYMLDNNLRVLYGSRTRSMPDVKSAGFIFYAGGMSLSWIANILYFQRLTDEATCYKMFKTDFIKAFPLVCMKFEFCPEVTAWSAKAGETIKEIPIMYYPRSVEEGKKIRAKDWFHAVWTLLNIRFKSTPPVLFRDEKFRKASFGEHKRSFLDNVIFQFRLAQIIPHIPKNIETIADYGCGFRADTLKFLLEKKYGKHGYGVDLSVTKEEDFLKANENISFSEADFELGKTVLKDNSIDVALSLAVLEHLNNPEIYLKDIYRTLKPGGCLLLTTPSPYSKPVLEFLAHKLKVIDKHEIDDHKHYFTLQELEDITKKVGFSFSQANYFELGVNDFLIARK
jgi:glycosyltransferase involved in cell wall biosynthesis